MGSDFLCSFAQKHQRYNISGDTWLQVFEFSRVVHEDLSNYDHEGNSKAVHYILFIRLPKDSCCRIIFDMTVL